jgi:hypothetical protein
MTFKIEKCLVVHETEKAILVEHEFFDTEDCQIWIPQSQVDEDSEIWKKGQLGDLVVSSWFAEQKGWL